MNFNYDEGLEYMQKLCAQAENKGIYSNSFTTGDFTIEYPGRKLGGDYRMLHKSKLYTHADVVNAVHKHTTAENHEQVITALDSIYQNGLRCEMDYFKPATKTLLYWITLQEEINYPRKNNKAGIKLPFQRFYEAVLAKLKYVDLQTVINRTNNHGKAIPELFHIKHVKKPSFYTK